MKKYIEYTKAFLMLITLLGFGSMKGNIAATSMTIPCTASYSVTNAQGIVITSGSLNNQNPIALGALCPGINLVVKITAPSFTTAGAYVSIGTSSTPITYTLLNTGTNTITIPITVFDPTQTLPASITVGPNPQYEGDGCHVFVFDIYPAVNPAFVINPNPVCLGSQVCFSLTGASSNPLAPQFFGYYNGPMTQTLYNNIAFNPPQTPDYTGTLSCNSSTLFGLGTHTITNVGAYNSIHFNNFCFNSVTHTFQVVPAQTAPSIVSSPSTAICVGSTATLTANASGAVSYTWYPGGSTGSTLAVTPTTNTTYTVIAANSSGCTNSAIYEMQAISCCIGGPRVINLSNVNIVAPGASTLVWSNLAYLGNYSGNIALPSAGYTITGAYNVIGGMTISTPVVFGSSHISFSDGIQVNQNATTTIDKSYWHGCDKNWKGIISNKQLTVSNSVIEDAQKAIDAVGTNSATPHMGLFIDNTIFNINSTGIVLSGVNFNDYRVTGCIFTSRAIPAANYVYTSGSRWTSLANFSNASLAAYNLGYMKGSAILSIASTERGQMGIWHNFASNLITGGNPTGDLKVGDASVTPTLNAQYTNVFDNLRIGIISNGSKNTIYNNFFQYINYNSSTDWSSSSACFYNSLNRSKVGWSVNGAAAVPYANKFTNSLNGVYGTSNGTLTLSNNQFSSVTQFGVWLDNWQQSAANTTTLAVTNNTFTTCLYDLYATANFSINLNFSNNVSTYPFVSVKPKVTYHAYITEFAKPTTAKYNLSFNNSTGKVNGIYSINIYAPVASNNTITVRTPIGSGFNAPIWLDNTDEGTIQSNKLNVSPINNQSYNTFGIFTNVGTNNLYCDNAILGAGSAMKFQGFSPSRIWKNNLNSDPSNPCIFGIFLDNGGQVGDIKYNNACAENVFGDFNAPPNGYDTYTQIGSTGAKIHVPSPFNSTNPFYPVNNIAGAPLPISTAFTPTLNNTINQAACGSGQQMMAMSAPISGSGNSSLSTAIPVVMNNGLSGNNSTKAIANKSTYEMARKGKLNVSGITGGSTFMNNQLNASSGSFYKSDSLVQLYLLNGNNVTLNQAKSLNASVNATNTPESNQKSFNVIYFDYVKNQGVLTNGQINSLKTLAALCPFTDGTSVYQARAMVKRFDTTEFFNACEYSQPISSGNRLMNSATELNTSKEAISTLVFPNPASTEITVTTDLDGAKLLIFNIVGQLVIESEINSITKINVSDFKNGTYIYKIVKDDKIIKADKLIISK